MPVKKASPNVLAWETYPSLKTETVQRLNAFVGIWFFPLASANASQYVLRPGGVDNGGGSPECQMQLTIGDENVVTTTFEAYVVAGDDACYRTTDQPAFDSTGTKYVFTPRYVKASCNSTASKLQFFK
ncbi:hypothetical protein HDV00_005331 [Rhizophlyctis rosea]|nr:hypothetical protein HDV00_005331 [Rhizophlyctis rosea]